MTARSTTPSVSVLICTRNRAGRLPELFGALERLDLAGIPHFEVVVVDNGSSDDTHALAQEWASKAPFPLRVLQEKRAGVSRAKNKAIRSSSGDLILCTDDDCLPEEDWIQGFVRAFDGDFRQLIGGRVELYNKDDADITLKTSMAPDRLTSTGDLLGFVHGCNMGFGRCVVDAIGGFDVRLGPGTACFAAEDTDFVYRVFAAGLPVRYEPGPVVYHNHGRSRAQDHHGLVERYNFGFGALVMKHSLRGRTDLVRPLYWTIRGIVRDWRSGVYSSAMGRTVTRFVAGSMHFLVRQSWRSGHEIHGR